jgi:hypothetical protein
MDLFNAQLDYFFLPALQFSAGNNRTAHPLIQSFLHLRRIIRAAVQQQPYCFSDSLPVFPLAEKTFRPAARYRAATI